MRFIYFITLLILLNSCLQEAKSTANIMCFEETLGPQKADALNKLSNSFDSFLSLNYPKSTNASRQFLLDIQAVLRKSKSIHDWDFRNLELDEIIGAVEGSGLRSEIWLFEDEEYTPIHLGDDFEDSLYLEIEDEIVPITPRNEDTLKVNHEESERNYWSFNRSGLYLYALNKCAQTDTLVQDYVNAKELAGDISPFIMVDSYLNNFSDYSDYFIKRLILIEFYYGIIITEHNKPQLD